ncbi:MAG TPA: VOC family protein [Mycobacteriales bacterium]|nr:VOC family protein [Mycobacteriales bacterium]
MALQSIGQILVSVSDIDRAVAFYRDALGLPLLFQVSGQPMAFFDCDGIRLYLGVPERPELRAAATLYFRVPDIDTSYAELTGRGVRFVEKPHAVHNDGSTELWLAFFRDTEGNLHALMEDRPA